MIDLVSKGYFGVELPEITERCRLACGAEAEAMGFPTQAGYDIYAAIEDDFEEWSEDEFIDWIMELQVLYGKVSRTGCQLIALHNRCNDIVRQYAQLV